MVQKAHTHTPYTHPWVRAKAGVCFGEELLGREVYGQAGSVCEFPREKHAGRNSPSPRSAPLPNNSIVRKDGCCVPGLPEALGDRTGP